MRPLADAFDRIDDFVAVQIAANGTISVEAVELLQRAVGIDGEARALIAERAAHLRAPAPGLLLGILIGMLAAADP